MKKFLSKISLFCLIFILMVFVLVFLSPTPQASKSLLFSKIKKDLLLEKEESPRIIFVGGSNLSFGLNSKMIKDSLDLNPINTGIHAGIGLIYMMESTLPYIREGDIVVLVPEYSQFLDDNSYGGLELFRTIMDVKKSDLFKLNLKQFFGILKYFPNYALSKMNYHEYFNVEESDIYSVDSFNEFGDVNAHWKMKKQDFYPIVKNSENLNYSVFDEIVKFERKIKEKKAILFISYPGLQKTSFENLKEEIKNIEKIYKENNFIILGTPERYMMPESMMFNTPYHLLKSGVDLRTSLLIEDIKKALRDNSISVPKQSL